MLQYVAVMENSIRTNAWCVAQHVLNKKQSLLSDLQDLAKMIVQVSLVILVMAQRSI